MSDRLTLCLPIDTVRQFDHTVTQEQITDNNFQATPDDRDMLASQIEDAEDEFRQLANVDMRTGRVGVAGRRETYEQITYRVKGHEAFKRSWSRVSGDYRATEFTKDLENDRILPFDPEEGDEAYVYRGLSRSTDEWHNITDERGQTWDIINYGAGIAVFHPLKLERAMRATVDGIGIGGAGRLRELRIAISYRYGGLGGSRKRSSQTVLTDAIDAEEMGTVSVEDGSGFPAGDAPGTIVVLLGSEYVEISPLPETDEMEIVTRGIRGTVAEDHGEGARIQYTPPAIRKAVAARAAMGLIQSGRYSKWLPDTDDDIDKNEMLEELRNTWNTTVEAMG